MDSKFSSQIFFLFIIGFLVVCAAVVAGMMIGDDEGKNVLFLLFGVAATIGMLLLGSRYWLILPFALTAQLPTIPLAGKFVDSGELATAACLAFFCFRLAFKKEKLKILYLVNLPILLFLGWVLLVFILNPTGLNIFGGEIVGGRFYLKIAMAASVYFLIFSQEPTEKDFWWIFVSIICAALFSSLWGISEYFFIGKNLHTGSDLSLDGNEFYTWHQLVSIPGLTGAMLLCAFYRPSKMIAVRHIWVLFALLLCLGLVFFSGKRMALALFLMTPIFAAFVYRQKKYIFIGAIVGVFTLLGVLVGHGTFFTLPLNVQRTLSWLPGDWAPELTGISGGQDDFRSELREIAAMEIAQRPFIGRGFALDIRELNMQMKMTTSQEAALYASARAWHNTWLGYAADFGIPLSVIQAFLYLSVLTVAFRLVPRLEDGSLAQAFAVYAFLFCMGDVMASWTSGQTATDAFSRWWMYGLLFLIWHKVKNGTSYSSKKNALSPTEVVEFPVANIRAS